MCRIAGILSKRKEPEKTMEQVMLMCDSMIHGGPDDFGYHIDENTNLCLGNRRLSILDLSSAGHQPMLSDDQNITITHNGEIYNFLLLRKQLIEAGFSFHTETDTEVIIKSYQYWGEDAFEKFNGIFAFCLFDKEKNCFYLVRDQSGVKPLYYSRQGDHFMFASEVKAFESSGISQSKNENWKIYYLAFGHIPEPFTTLKSVFVLPKGSFLKYEILELGKSLPKQLNFN